MYVVIENNFDDERIQFYNDATKAFDDFEELKKDFDPMISRGAAILNVTGEGVINIQMEYSGSDGVEVLDSFDEYSI